MEPKKTRVYMGAPSTGTRADSQTYALREIAAKYADTIELVYPKQCVHRSFHDFARNEIVEEFLRSDCDILWFLDSDICPPTHILDLVAKHGDKWQAAGAPYPIFMVPPGGTEPCVLFTAYKGVVHRDDGSVQGIQLTSVPRAGTEFIDGLATGCLFLKRSVFEKLEKPYFEFKYDKESRKMTEGEDLGFCVKVNKQGIQFFVDYDLVCKHYKTVCLLDINNYATSMSNAKVLEYDAEVRPKVAELLASVEVLKAELRKARSQIQPRPSLYIP